jgi:putative pyruvate formate lyase activating enzyme
MGTLPVVARAARHMWEEPCISGTRGSGTVFFSGCTLGCVFCQNERISHHPLGQCMDAAQLCELFERVEALGVHNLNLVTPSHFAPEIFKALKMRKMQIPVVWNTSGYENVEIIDAAYELFCAGKPEFRCTESVELAPVA